MKYFTLLKANIKRQKGSFIGVFILIFIITVSLCAVLTIWRNSSTYEEEQINRLGFGDVTSWLYGKREEADALLTQIESIDEVEKVGVQDILFVDYKVNERDTTAGGTGFALQYSDTEYEYNIYKDALTGIEENPKPLQRGEIYVPPCFTTLYDAKIGDMVEIEITGEEDVEIFTIKGYFEDPVSGSSMMGLKSMLINDEDWQRLLERFEEAGENAVTGGGYAFHIFKKNGKGTVSELQRKLNEETDLGRFNSFTYQKTTITGFMLILQNIFSGLFLVFVLVLLVVAMLVLSHSIVSSIEQDYADMGILKAVGFTKGMLQVVKIGQYVLPILLGMTLGITVSVPVVSAINRITVPATGLMIPAALPVSLMAASLSVILLILTGFIFFKTAKIDKITPIRAIRGGIEDVYFKSRLMLPVGKRALQLQLAIRQLISGKRQYISAGLVTVLLVFFLSLTARIDAWLGPDGDGLMETFNSVPYDMGVQIIDHEVKPEGITDLILEDTKIVDSYGFLITRTELNGMNYMTNICDRPEYYNMMEGRACLYDNEVVVTEFAATALGVKTGDSVQVTCEGKSLDFIISGIYQCANDMGDNFGMSKSGYERFAIEGETEYFTYYRLEETEKKDEIVERLLDVYGDRIYVDDNIWSGTDSILFAMNAIGMLMYVVTVIFIFVVIIMTGSKILYREQKDLGIYKSLGFSSESLRLTFSLRFTVVAFVGAILGCICSAVFTDKIIGYFLKFAGISRFASKLTLVQMVLPAFGVVVLFTLFAYIAAGKIRKVELRNLINMC